MPVLVAESVVLQQVQVFNRDLSILVISCFAEIYKTEKEEAERKKAERFVARQEKLEEKAKAEGTEFKSEEVRGILPPYYFY